MAKYRYGVKIRRNEEDGVLEFIGSMSLVDGQADADRPKDEQLVMRLRLDNLLKQLRNDMEQLNANEMTAEGEAEL